MSYIKVSIQQGTKEWLEWRSQGIGASDAPAIMGENPWKRPETLLQEKCFGEEKVECDLLDELNIEHIFYLIVLISLLMIIRDSKKKQETLNNLLDVLVAK